MIKIGIVVILIVTNETKTETGIGLTETEEAPVNADTMMTINIVIGIGETPETAETGTGTTIAAVAVTETVIVEEMIHAMKIVVRKEDVKMGRKEPLTASVERKTATDPLEMPGVRGGTAPGILTGGDVTGTQTKDEDPLAVLMDPSLVHHLRMLLRKIMYQKKKATPSSVPYLFPNSLLV